MNLTDVAMVMIGCSLVGFLLLQAAALLMALRRPATDNQVSTGSRLLWTLVPLMMVALMFGSLLIGSRISL